MLASPSDDALPWPVVPWRTVVLAGFSKEDWMEQFPAFLLAHGPQADIYVVERSRLWDQPDAPKVFKLTDSTNFTALSTSALWNSTSAPAVPLPQFLGLKVDLLVLRDHMEDQPELYRACPNLCSAFMRVYLPLDRPEGKMKHYFEAIVSDSSYATPPHGIVRQICADPHRSSKSQQIVYRARLHKKHRQLEFVTSLDPHLLRNHSITFLGGIDDWDFVDEVAEACEKRGIVCEFETSSADKLRIYPSLARAAAVILPRFTPKLLIEGLYCGLPFFVPSTKVPVELQDMGTAGLFQELWPQQLHDLLGKDYTDAAYQYSHCLLTYDRMYRQLLAKVVELYSRRQAQALEGAIPNCISPSNCTRPKCLSKAFQKDLRNWSNKLAGRRKRGVDVALVNGNGTCTLPAAFRAPLIILPGQDIGCESEDPIHVVYSGNVGSFVGLFTSLMSALLNAPEPGRLRFHIIVPGTASLQDTCGRLKPYVAASSSYLCEPEQSRALPRGVSIPPCSEASDLPGASCHCGSPQFHIMKFQLAEAKLVELQELLGMLGQFSTTSRLDLFEAMNFARNFADDLLLPHGVRRMIYLDTDTLVLGNLTDLWATKFEDGNIFGAVYSCSQRMHEWYNFKQPIVKATLTKSTCYMNAGAYLMDLEGYRDLGIQQRIGQLLQLHVTHGPVWTKGVHQPSFILALANHTQGLDRRWNMHGLGWQKQFHWDQLLASSVLHFTGKHKPWNGANGWYKPVWRPYSLECVGSELNRSVARRRRFTAFKAKYT
ncbi:hypothetical protein WJX72_005798 [[Myrmecia] bisecta]|uniref:Uncharacterized protein n=1 Tax=[Myrmecia] bisecta TaxID=41462 RepID=A0AAW1Q165_9CHLO